MILKWPLAVNPEFVEMWMQNCCALPDLPLSKEQRQAVILAAFESVVTLTRNPGVGKSHTTRAIVEFWEAVGKQVALASPTRRAARLADLSQRQFCTLHRLLKYGSRSGYSQWGETHPIVVNFIVINELSMTDIFLAHALIKAASIHLKFSLWEMWSSCRALDLER